MIDIKAVIQNWIVKIPETEKFISYFPISAESGIELMSPAQVLVKWDSFIQEAIAKALDSPIDLDMLYDAYGCDLVYEQVQERASYIPKDVTYMLPNGDRCTMQYMAEALQNDTDDADMIYELNEQVYNNCIAILRGEYDGQKASERED